MKYALLPCLLAFFLHTATAQKEITIIPTPVKMEMKSGMFTITANTKIVADKALTHEAGMLNTYLKQLYGFQLPIDSKAGKSGIRLLLAAQHDDPEAYALDVRSNGITISSADPRGVFLGIQTLLQLIPPDTRAGDPAVKISIPQMSIQDHPAFGYRGMHLDVGRHFFSNDFIKKYIDYIAMQKLNTFHWHLTEDQGWRIEIKKYPKLTTVGGFRNGTIIGRYPGTGNTNERYGGFYTQDEVRDIVKYAADRHITVIPEIEMPGHASAAIAAYPKLSCFPDESTKVPARITWAGDTTGKQVQQAWGVFPDIFCPTEYTFGFLEDVLDEVMDLFPSTYIHIGGDEAPKENWKRCDHCQQMIRDKNLKDEHGLQSYFIQRIEKYLNDKGRKIIGWDEILEGGLAPNATVMSWRGEEGGIAAANDDHDVIMTPTGWMYFDYSQTKQEDSVTIGGFIPLEKVYEYSPVPEKLDKVKAKHVLGAQANVWTEYMHTPSKVEYMIFPRMSALSEVLWSGSSRKDWADFQKSLPAIYKRYYLWGANYFGKDGGELKAEK